MTAPSPKHHHHGAHAGTCKWAGARGGLAVLDNIETTPFKQVYLQLLPSLGGYQAGYLAYDIANRAVGLVICAQLVITEPGVSPLTAPAATMAAAARCVVRVIAHSASREAIDSMRSNPEHWLQVRAGCPTVSGPLCAELIGHAAICIDFCATRIGGVCCSVCRTAD